MTALWMRLVIGFYAMTGPGSSAAGVPVIRPDTVAHWQIYYGGQLVSQGDEENFRVPAIGFLTMSLEGAPLKIFYNYGTVYPKWRKIVIKIGTQVLVEDTQNVGDRFPTWIYLSEVLKDRKKGDMLLQIFYSDNITKEKDRLIGKIVVTKVYE